MAVNFNPHASAIAKLKKMLDGVEDRLPGGGDGSQETKIRWGDVRKWNMFRADLADDLPAQKQMNKWIEEQSQGGPWIPFQPATLHEDGRVEIPERFRVGPGPGDIVALYDARPDPRVRLLVDYDTMLLKAARALEDDIPKLVELVRAEANDDGALSRDEVNAIRLVIDALEAAAESIEPLMEFRQKLAQRVIDVPPPIYIMPPDPR